MPWCSTQNASRTAGFSQPGAEHFIFRAYSRFTLYAVSMREDLTCQVKGRVVKPDGTPSAGRMVEFLPTRFYFIKDAICYGALGAKTETDEDGWFTVTLTRTDLTDNLHYLTRGAIGNYLIDTNGPGPHLLSALRKAGRRMEPLAHDS